MALANAVCLHGTHVARYQLIVAFKLVGHFYRMLSAKLVYAIIIHAILFAVNLREKIFKHTVY